MCGIYGIAIFKGCTVRHSLLRPLLRKLALESQVRGTHATGYAFTSSKGITIFKHNVSADKFTKLDDYKKITRENMSSFNTFGFPYSIIGHTRFQTKGSPMNPGNNHPIKAGSIVGVHNGHINNDDYIFDFLKEASNNEVERIAQVDSEAIFSLINHFANVHKFPSKYVAPDIIGHIEDPTTTAIIEASKKLVGSYACAVTDADNPKMLWLFKNNGPIDVNYYREEKLMIFASSDRFINKSTELFNFSVPDSLVIDSCSGMAINITNGKYYMFGLDGAKPSKYVMEY